MQSYYNKYRAEIIECPFCKNIVSMPNFAKHIKSKSCKSFQQTFKKKEHQKILFDIRTDINKIRSAKKYNLDELHS